MLETEKLPKVAMVIPAKDKGDFIATTVRASKAIPRADSFVVIDDSSSDDTGGVARSVGAVVVRHSVNHGKASVMEAGTKTMAMRDSEEDPAHLILFLDADLGDSATGTYPLVKTVMSDRVDCAIANLPKRAGAGGHGFITRPARSTIRWATGQELAQPLSGQHCLQPKAFFDCLPLSPSWGVETSMAIDLLVQGCSVQEIPCELTHRATGNDFAGYTHRLHQFLCVLLAATMHFIRHVRVPRQLHLSVGDTQVFGTVYQPRTTG